MSKGHLFSASLFNTLFQHNLISSDGYVKATDDQILAFRKFLVQQAKDRTTNLYKVRKEMVDEVSNLLKQDELTPKETKKLVLLLHQLNLRITPEGILESEEPEKREPRYLGSSEPNKSTWEWQLLEKERRLEVLQRDLKELDDWLVEINKPDTKVHKSAIKLPSDSKKDEFRYRARTGRRNMDMERARRRLIATYHAENAKNLRKTLSRIEYPGRVRFVKSSASQTDKRKESDESFVTAPSEFSFLLQTPHSVTQKEMQLARNIFNPCEEEDSHLKVKKSKATEKIEVHPGFLVGIDERIKFRPTEGITTFVSEPILATSEADFVVASKRRRYNSESKLDGKSNAIGSTIDEAKQYIVIYGEEGKETVFKVHERDTDEKFKSDERKIPAEIDDNRPKSILKVSRKSVKMSASSAANKTGNITSKDSKRVSKEGSIEYENHKTRPTSKHQSIENSKGRKVTSSSLMRKKVPELTPGVRAVKLAGRDKDGNNAKIGNKQKIIDSKVNNKEKRNILETRNGENRYKHETDSQVERKPIGKSITPKGKKDSLKSHPMEHKGHKNRPISGRQSKDDKKEITTTTNSSMKRKNVTEITQGEKEVKPAGQYKEENNPKINNKQKIIDSKDKNDGTGIILKTKNAADESKLQAERRPNLTQGKADNKNHDELRDKNVKDHPKIESKEDDGLSVKQKPNKEKDFKIAQLTEPNKNDFADDKNKMATDNQEKNIDSEEDGKRKKDSPTSDNEGDIEEQSKLKEDSRNKNDDELRDKTIKGHPKIKSKEKHEKFIDSKEGSKKKEDSPKGNIKEQLQLKEKAAKSKKYDGQIDKIIKGHHETDPKEDKVLTDQNLSLVKDFQFAQRSEKEKSDQNLSLEKDFQFAQRSEKEKSDLKSANEDRFDSNAGSVENVENIEENEKEKDDDVTQEKDANNFDENNPEDTETLTLDKELSREVIASSKSKEMRQRNSKE